MSCVFFLLFVSDGGVLGLPLYGLLIKTEELRCEIDGVCSVEYPEPIIRSDLH